jgi:hypothetical protein
MARITLTATTLDGSTVTRTSETRTYTHAIVGNGVAHTWCGNLQLAQKQLARYQNSYAAAEGYKYAIAEATTR